jgi:hypothetical protein
MTDDHGYLVRTLSELVGRPLTSVVFIHDYLQFVFDGPTLTALTIPTFQSGERSLARAQPGYCDAVCALIEVLVEKIEVNGQQLEIGFANGAVLQISLAESEYTGPEAINYTGENGNGIVA